MKARNHAFVVRIWHEGAGREEVWRGHITHVMTEERLHFERLPEILRFIQQHLEGEHAVGDRPRQKRG